ncbi:MAG TPA: DUF4349 domain-containing protein [Phycisphaerae bacterium]|nr:DUF4349 domain-containing protein [Phycisphaerae bacterium]
MWKIVRQNNVTPKAFNSPSTADVPDPAQDTTAYYDQAGPSDAKTPAYQYQRDPARTIVGTSSEPTISTNSESAESTGGRAVIQSGTIELISKDVSASFLKVQRLVRLEAGEYLENSYVSGDAQYMQANLTLRVAADRLDEVLNELRQIGKIVTEQIQGRDVTAEVVDVEARLRNERSIETELLELLDTRKDAPLKELLELRDALKNVRYTIESLDGRRATLAHMVSLASILVTIRPDSAPPPEAPIAYWQYFGEEMTSAWQQSIHFLARAFAVIVRIALGGLPLWALIAVVVLLVRRRGRAG